MENQVHFEILQVATTQKLQRFTVNQCVVICGYSAVSTQNVVFLHIIENLQYS